MISFTDFTKSRNLKTTQFSGMSYPELVAFCEARSVKPPSYSDFLSFAPAKLSPAKPQAVVSLEPEIVFETQTFDIEYQPLEFSRLKKAKKSTLQTLCTDRDIQYTDATTKRELLALLKEFENINE